MFKEIYPNSNRQRYRNIKILLPRLTCMKEFQYIFISLKNHRILLEKKEEKSEIRERLAKLRR